MSQVASVLGSSLQYRKLSRALPMQVRVKIMEQFTVEQLRSFLFYTMFCDPGSCLEGVKAM